jgi:hypothetical protein
MLLQTATEQREPCWKLATCKLIEAPGGIKHGPGSSGKALSRARAP